MVDHKFKTPKPLHLKPSGAGTPEIPEVKSESANWSEAAQNSGPQPSTNLRSIPGARTKP